MASGLLIVVFVLILLPLGYFMSITKANNLADRIATQVQANGGTVLGHTRKIWGKGPFWVKGKGQQIVKLIYQDATGHPHQAWGRTGLFGDDIRWDYDDSDYTYDS